MKMWLHFASASGREASREKMVLPGAGGAVKEAAGPAPACSLMTL